MADVLLLFFSRCVLVEQNPKILYDPMPIILLQPGLDLIHNYTQNVAIWSLLSEIPSCDNRWFMPLHTHIHTHTQLRRRMSKILERMCVHCTRRVRGEVYCPLPDTPQTMFSHSNYQQTSQSSTGYCEAPHCCVSWMTSCVKLCRGVTGIHLYEWYHHWNVPPIV